MIVPAQLGDVSTLVSTVMGTMGNIQNPTVSGLPCCGYRLVSIPPAVAGSRVGSAPAHSGAPASKSAGGYVAPHDLDDFRLANTKLGFNRFKGRSVFPRHFNDATDIRG